MFHPGLSPWLHEKVSTRPGLFTLLEIVPVISIILVMAGVVYFTLNPMGNLEKARNNARTADIVLLADALAEYMRDGKRGIFLQLPVTSPGIEICADTVTRNCNGKLDLNALLGEYLTEIPRDPSLTDSPTNAASGYFVRREGEQHFTITAMGTEPEGAEEITVTR